MIIGINDILGERSIELGYGVFMFVGNDFGEKFLNGNRFGVGGFGLLDENYGEGDVSILMDIVDRVFGYGFKEFNGRLLDILY